MRNLFELLFYLKELLLLLLAVLVSLTLLLTSDSEQAVAMQGVYANIVGAVPRPSLDFSDLISYKAENQTLRQRLIRYTLLNAELADMARENQRLRRMLGFTESSPFRLQVAEVISRGASSVLSTVTLNVGAEQEVVPNQPVLTLDGLLGKTLTVAPEATVVHLVTDRNFRLSVKVGSQGLRGILRPLYGSEGEIIGISSNGDIVPGDRVLTSGFSDIYPKNLPVGEVLEVINIPGESYSRVRVNLYADPQNAEHVFVMISRGDGP